MCRSYWLPLSLVTASAVGVVPVAALPQESRPAPDPIRLAREVFLKSTSTLKSGMGKGTFHCYRETSDGATVVYSGKLTSHLKDGRYNVRLQYDDPQKSGRTLRIIICDKSGLFSSDFWELPVGGVRGEGYVHHGVANNVPSAAEFPWDLSRPWVSSVDALVKNIPIERFKITELAGKDFELRHDVGTQGSFSTVEFLEKYGWNASKRVSYRDAQTPPFEVFEATWRQKKDQWYVDSLTYQMDARFRNGGFSRWIMKYETFVPNCPVSNHLFTLDALELEPRSRILDFVPNEKTRQYLFEKNRDRSQDELDTILSQIRTLPERR